MVNVGIGLGLSVIVGTHILLLNASLPDAVKNRHAFLNLAAAALIAANL